MKFEWNLDKAAANLRKHGVSFEEAMTAFTNDFCATARDMEHSHSEQRFIAFGFSAQGRPLAVSHTERGDRIRIITARLMTRLERKIYEES